MAKKGHVAWNKGLTKETDERVNHYSESLKANPKCKENGHLRGISNRGLKRTKKHLEALHEGAKKHSKQFTQEEMKKVVELYLTPMNISQVEKVSGVSTYFISRILNKLNIPRHSKEVKMQLMVEANKNTKLKRYGDPYYTNIEKRNVTLSNKDEIYWENRKEKVKQTCLKKYGVTNVRKAKEIKSKIKETKLEKYGDATYSNRQKAEETCLEKYGVINYSQSSEFINRESKFRKYKIGDIYFDSFPELCVYLYFTEQGFSIERNVDKFEYTFENKIHYCFVDFRIGNRLIEIKSDYLYQNMLIPNTKENEKLKCLLAHNVEIWTSELYDFYINWFTSTEHKIDNYLV